MEWGETTKLSGPRLEINRLKAILVKKFYFNYRNRMMFITQILFPVVVVVLMVCGPQIMEDKNNRIDYHINNTLPHNLTVRLPDALIDMDSAVGKQEIEVEKEKILRNRKMNRLLFKLTMGLSMGVIFQSNMIGSIYVLERTSGAMNLQFIAGLHPINYWLYSFIYDLLVYFLSMSFVMLLYIFKYDCVTVGLLELVGIEFLFAFAIHPCIYLRARRYRSQNALFIHVMIVGSSTFIFYLIIMGLAPRGIGHDILNIIPFFNLCDSLYNWHRNKLGTTEFIERNNLHLNNLLFLTVGAVHFILLFLHDLKLMNWFYEWKDPPARPHLGNVDQDVRDEMKKVDLMSPAEIRAQLLVAKHLMKSYDSKVAVKDVTFILNR